MGADPQPGGQILGALASYGFAEIVRFPHQARPCVVARGCVGPGSTSQTLWQSLERDEQEAFIALMATLSFRAARS